MKLILSLLLLLPLHLFAQPFQPDWYIIEPGTGIHLKRKSFIDNKDMGNEVVISQAFHPGQAVFVREVLGTNIYVAEDLAGRQLYLKGTLTRVKHTENAVYAMIKTNSTNPLKLPDGGQLAAIATVWVLSHNMEDNTYTIQYKNNTTVNIPADNISLYKAASEKELSNGTITFQIVSQ